MKLSYFAVFVHISNGRNNENIVAFMLKQLLLLKREIFMSLKYIRVGISISDFFL